MVTPIVEKVKAWTTHLNVFQLFRGQFVSQMRHSGKEKWVTVKYVCTKLCCSRKFWKDVQNKFFKNTPSLKFGDLPEQ